MTKAQLAKFLATPKSMRQIINKFGITSPSHLMRELSDSGTTVYRGMRWTDHGSQRLYWVGDLSLSRTRRLGIADDSREVV